ncbi:hypothetical protein EC991_000992 [Linnemannia zychae]|nr:hypothetical protein EC991_000992 [Linnemannia zychae]
MKPDPFQETPHYRYPSGGSVSSVDYDSHHRSSSVSSMENHTTLNSTSNSISNGSSLKKQPSFGFSHLSSQRLPQQQQQLHPTQSLSTLSTPQSSPQSTRVGYQHGLGRSSYQYSSGSEDDHESLSSQEPESLGDLPRSSSAYRVRRDSGLPPLKMNAAKRLPPFNTSLTSMATDSVVEEEEEGDEEDDDTRHSMSRRMHHEVDESSILEEDEEEDDQEDDEMRQLRDRDTSTRQTNNLFRNGESGGSKQSSGPRMFPNHSPFHPFPSPPSRTTPAAASTTTQQTGSFPSPTSSSTSIPAHGSGSQHSGSNTSLPRPVEPDRGPADLSNPSAALAEALSAARASAEARAKAQQQAQQQAALDALLVGHNRVHSQSADAGYREDSAKRNSSTSGDSNDSLSANQVRIPVPDLSPTMQGYTGHLNLHQGSGRNTDGRPFPHQTSFTLSPTSSNPELTGSQSDSHSGSYGIQRTSSQHSGNDINNNSAHSVQSSGSNLSKYGLPNTRLGNPSISSNMSRYSEDYNERPQYPRHRESSLLGTSYDSAQSVRQHGGEGYSRYAFAGQDMGRSSLNSQGYMDDFPNSSVYPQALSREPFGFQQDYTNQRRVDFPNESDSRVANGKQHHNNQDAGARSGHSASVASASLYPHTASSHSLGLSEDLKDQISTEAEYIMNRNTELLRILSIRDDEVQTLQQELDHTLKVMHEYEDDLMAMHTAAAKPYETYRQTLDEIGHGMTQQDALLQGYQQENEKLTSQLKSSVEIRQEAEKRHLQTVERLKNELSNLRSELENSDQEKYGTTDLRFLLKQSQENQERAQSNFKDKEEEYLTEIRELKERLKVTEEVLDEERKSKVEGMQKLERDLQEFRSGHDGMLAQLNASEPQLQSKRGSSSSSADEGHADTTADDEIERDISLIKASLLKGQTKFSPNTKSPTPSLTHTMDRMQQFKDPKPKALDRKLTSTETLTSGNMSSNPDGEKMDLEQRLSKFEADVRQSLLRSSSMESFGSVRSSGGTAIPMATHVKPLHQGQQHLQHQYHSSSRDDLRLSAMSEEHRLANKLRDRINTLNIENKRLHQELASLSQALRVQQTERQRKVAQLEELLDMHETQASQKLDDVSTEEGQARVRKVIQGLLVRIRTKEAEAEFYHNAYLDKVMELDQMALANGKSLLAESPAEDGHPKNENTSSTPSPTASVIEALEIRVRELERLNMETAFHLAAEKRRVQATETENGTLIREKLTLARTLEDQVDQLQSKLSLVEIARARLQDENTELKLQQQQQQYQSQQQGAKDARGPSSTPNSNRPGDNAFGQQQDGNLKETMAAMRTRMLSLTRQRDQLKEQLQEAFDIQLTMQERSGPSTGAGSGEWSVEEFKKLERSLEEKSIELSIWKERAVALEKVVERIRMIRDRPEPIGLSMDRSLTMDSESMSTSSVGGSHDDGVQHHAGRRSSHHTLEELDQVVLRLEQRLERRDQELQEVVQEARRQTDLRLEAWKAKWVQVVQRKNAEIHRFQVELESLMAAVDRDRSRMAAAATK